MLKGKTTPFKIAANLFTLPGTVKGRLLIKAGTATVFQTRSVSWIVCFGHETDMHPVDLIRDSSMSVTPKF